MEQKTKMYAYNRNARAHGESIYSFAILSFGMATIGTVGVLILAWGNRACDQAQIMTSVLAVIFTQVALFAAMMLIMCLFYWLLNEQQAKEHKTPPPHQDKDEKREIPGKRKAKKGKFIFD